VPCKPPSLHPLTRLLCLSQSNGCKLDGFVKEAVSPLETFCTACEQYLQVSTTCEERASNHQEIEEVHRRLEIVLPDLPMAEPWKSLLCMPKIPGPPCWAAIGASW
jgi:hypothetical protein